MIAYTPLLLVLVAFHHTLFNVVIETSSKRLYRELDLKSFYVRILLMIYILI